MQRLIRVFEDFMYGFDSGVDVPMEAAHALVRGLGSPALRDLAGLDVREYEETSGSVEAAERDFRARALAVVDGCRTCTIASHR